MLSRRILDGAVTCPVKTSTSSSLQTRLISTIVAADGSACMAELIRKADEDRKQLISFENVMGFIAASKLSVPKPDFRLCTELH